MGTTVSFSVGEGHDEIYILKDRCLIKGREEAWGGGWEAGPEGKGKAGRRWGGEGPPSRVHRTW